MSGRKEQRRRNKVARVKNLESCYLGSCVDALERGIPGCPETVRFLV